MRAVAAIEAATRIVGLRFMELSSSQQCVSSTSWAGPNRAAVHSDNQERAVSTKLNR
jgi:hypothetical protein